MFLYSVARPLLFRLDPETAHDLTLRSLAIAMRLGLLGRKAPQSDRPPIEVMGLRFPNPVGLAAGLDKNGDCIDALFALGFGFVEIGTVTPLAQPGNPKPRMFRIPRADAIINRMGFNNRGVDDLIARLEHRRGQGILGINIGKNFDTPIEHAVSDYLQAMRKVYPFADYITINISSPNTQNLRDLQRPDSFAALLEALKKEQARLSESHGKYVPLAVKIAPDLQRQEVSALAGLLMLNRIDAVIATNTSTNRAGIAGLPHGAEAGGLSGKPIFEQSTRIVQYLAAELKGTIPIIACGGIVSAEDAIRKKAAGAQLIQLYTGLIYQGPKLIGECISAFG